MYIMKTTKFDNFLLSQDLIFFENSPEIAIEKNRLKTSNKVYFSATLPYSVKQSLSEKFGLDLTGITKFPMAWIKGDTPHHIDVGSCGFKNTYLVYLNDSPGEFIVNDEPYPITKNTAYVFSEGLAHKTINTGTEPRLLLGPMNEFVHPVGANINYYSSQANALNNVNSIANSGGSYTVETKRGLQFWRIASNSNGTSSQSISYQAGDTLNDDGIYYLYADPERVGSLTYFATEADALANTNSIGSDVNATLILADVGGYLEWRIASNSTGTSDQGVVYNISDPLNYDGNYYVYPVIYDSVIYYPTEADALAETNSIGTGSSLIVETIGDIFCWRLASNSTGLSPQSNLYISGVTLISPGNYYLYPAPIYTNYYILESDALAKTNIIAYPESTYIVGSYLNIVSWEIASNSTGTSTGLGTYLEFDTLNQDGIYYLYATPAVGIVITYYSSEANAAAKNFAIGTSQNYVIDIVNGIDGWKIHSSSTGTASRIINWESSDRINNVGVYYMSPYSSNTNSVIYYPTQADALAETNSIGSSISLTVETKGGYSSFRIASNSTGTSSQLSVYNTSDVLNDDGNYNLYPAGQIPCFLEGTTILCKVDDVESYLPIETIKPGTLVKTSLNGYKKVELIGKGNICNPGNNERIEKRLYKCSPNKYAELKEDLYITGCHSILVNNITDLQREQTIRQSGKIFVTDKKYRLMACIDERAEPWCSEGTYTIWHVALENDDIKMNYGVYANGGLLVETCSINYMRTKANMQLIS